jgi:hypothetical protein
LTGKDSKRPAELRVDDRRLRQRLRDVAKYSQIRSSRRRARRFGGFGCQQFLKITLESNQSIQPATPQARPDCA